MLYNFPKLPFALLFKLLYRLKVEGLENLPREGALILVANHSSYFDPLVLGVAITRRINWMVMKAYYDLWLLRWFFKLSYAFRVDVDRPDISAIKHAFRVLKAGGIVGIFPEGSRSFDGRLKEGKTGAALLSLKSGTPILPVAIKGAFEAYPPKAIWPRVHPITIRIGRLLTFEGIDRRSIDEEGLSMATEKIMSAIRGLMD